MTQPNQQDYFPIWSISRGDIAETAQPEANGDEPAWPDHLTDNQMQRIADRMQDYLDCDTNGYWEALRDAVDDVRNRTFLRVKE